MTIDEAHSSTSGEAMKDMKTVLGASTLVTAEQATDPLTVAEVSESQTEDEADDAVDLIAESMTARGAQANLAFFLTWTGAGPGSAGGDLDSRMDGPIAYPYPVQCVLDGHRKERA